MSMIINNKKVVGTEQSVNPGDLGIFAGSDDNWYVKKSDGTSYPLSQSVKTVKITIPTAQVLTLYTTPVAFGLTVPVGYYAQLLSAQMKATYGGTPYATNVTLEIGFPSVKAIFSDNVLGFNANAFFNMDFESSGAQVSATDVVVSVNAGNPTAGNSDIDIYLTYTLVEL